ncbi:MAG: LysM peptidoglycan-binding domain-containing protein [Gammaproteobacteria bacterium]|nr:LysM peptidoglycan-binding domain-containing protein [Gammaproteobacteria bacterium]
MNNKMTGLRLASVLLPTLIIFGSISLSGCSTSQPTTIQEEPMVQEEPMEPTQEIETQPEAPEVAYDYPERYVVVKGDTLWDISKRFLKDPWRWPSVWHINPGINNPHLIYPGDVIVMYIINGKPYITLDGKAGVRPTGNQTPKLPPEIKPGLKVVKLSPSARVSGIHKAITTISMTAIRPFLDRPRVVTEDMLDDAPYIVSSYEEHLISGTGNRVYAKNMENPISAYNIVRPGKPYVDPESGDTLGYEAIYLADARLVKAAEDDKPATLVVTKALREVLNNDVLIPYEQREEMFQFTPRSPEANIKGQIIDVFNGVSLIGQHMVVVLNRGEDDGLAPGHVLAVMKKGARVHDSQAWLFTGVDLPDERAGIMMVFKTYKNLSYALIMEANRAMSVNDRFEKP